MRKVTLIPGDGTGPALIRAARRVLDASGAAIEWEEVEAGQAAFARSGDPVPAETLDSLRRTGVALKGPMSVPSDGYTSPNRGLYQAIAVYAQVRLAYHFPGSQVGQPATAIAIVREMTESLGRGPQDWLGEDAGFAMKIITRAASERIARFCFDYTLAHGLRKVMVPHQAPSLRSTDGLFLRTVMAVATGYPGIEVRDEAMDGLCMHLAQRPQNYQVILAEAFYGGILAGLCAGLAGSVGLMPGGNFGPTAAIFEAGHGSAPGYAGQNKLNPTGVILSGALLLEHIGETAAAQRVWEAVRVVIGEGRRVTYDLGGTAGTTEMAEAIVEALTASPRG